jgi:ferredoxin-NADP reductase
VTGWSGHRAGQHVDLRLTAADGYSTQRSFSIASAAGSATVQLTVQTVPGGEVSPYLTRELRLGDDLELRGPVGGWFVWQPDDTRPVLLVAGGSGIVPLMSMIRTRRAVESGAPFRLVYSVRSADDVIYANELRALPAADPALAVGFVYTRAAPDGHRRPPGRLTAPDLPAPTGAPAPVVYVCGPTGFVETTARLLIEAGHAASAIRTERFG